MSGGSVFFIWLAGFILALSGDFAAGAALMWAALLHWMK